MILDLAAESCAARVRTAVARLDTVAATDAVAGALDRAADRLLALPAEPLRTVT